MLSSNIKANNNTISLDKKKAKKNFIIPWRFISYQNSSLVNIIVDINYKSLLKSGVEYCCDYNLLNIVEEFDYNYFLKKINSHSDIDDKEDINSDN